MKVETVVIDTERAGSGAS